MNRNLFLILFIAVTWVGVEIGYKVSLYPHEAGHYFFSYIANSSSIEKVEFYPTPFLIQDFPGVLMKSLSGSDLKKNNTFGVRGGVIFKGSAYDIFDGVWFDLVSMGGLIFSLFTLFSLVYILESISLPRDDDEFKGFIFLILIGIFLGVIVDAHQGWWRDMLMLFIKHDIPNNIGIRIIQTISLLILWFGFFLYFKYSKKFLRFFPSHFPRELSLSLIWNEIKKGKI